MIPAAAAGLHSAMAAGERSPLTFTIGAPLQRADLPGLCEAVCDLLTDHPGETLRCDVSDARPDAVTVEALALIALASLRHGCRVRMCDASLELRQLVEFMGLDAALPST